MKLRLQVNHFVGLKIYCLFSSSNLFMRLRAKVSILFSVYNCTEVGTNYGFIFMPYNIIVDVANFRYVIGWRYTWRHVNLKLSNWRGLENSEEVRRVMLNGSSKLTSRVVRESNGSTRRDVQSSEAASVREVEHRELVVRRCQLVRRGGCGRLGNGATQQSSGTSRPQAPRIAQAQLLSLGTCIATWRVWLFLWQVATVLVWPKK